MFIAQELRKNNIAEYLLYMWQIEELLRAFSLDMEFVEKNIVEPYPNISQEQKKMLYEWYESLIEMMKRENVEVKGHLQINKNSLSQIEEFHMELYSDPNQKEYKQTFHNIQPLLLSLKKQHPDSANIGDIELCFTFLFGIMTLKMKNTAISETTSSAQTEISQFLKILSNNFKRYEAGELS